MDYNNDPHNRLRTTDTTAETAAKSTGVGIGAAIVIALIAIAAYFMFNGKDDTANTVEADGRSTTSTVVEKVKDGAAEIPQAAKDATTDGDQKTTRPNDDESKDKLDQK